MLRIPYNTSELCIQWMLEVLPPGIRRLKRDADHSLPSDAAVENLWKFFSSPPVRRASLSLLCVLLKCDFRHHVVYKDVHMYEC